MILEPIRQHPRIATAVGVGLGILLLALIAGGIFLARTFGMPPQPIPYNHSVHIAAGAQCVFCHPGVDKGAVAGVPSLTKCMGCHQNVDPQDPAKAADIDQMIAKYQAGEPVRWIKINDQPDFVQFTHRPHVTAGVACETCHGDVSNRVYPQRYTHNMGWCLNCHRSVSRDDPALRTRLIDCGTCHY